MVCIQWCSYNAIDYYGKTTKRKHYYHKEVTAQEFIKENR